MTTKSPTTITDTLKLLLESSFLINGSPTYLTTDHSLQKILTLLLKISKRFQEEELIEAADTRDLMLISTLLKPHASTQWGKNMLDCYSKTIENSKFKKLKRTQYTIVPFETLIKPFTNSEHAVNVTSVLKSFPLLTTAFEASNCIQNHQCVDCKRSFERNGDYKNHIIICEIKKVIKINFVLKINLAFQLLM